MTVRNMSEAKIAISCIRLFEDCAKKDPSRKISNDRDSYIVQTKRSLRKFLKRTLDERIVKDNGFDGYISLVTLSEYVQDEESAKEYFEEELRLVCYPSQYDCTGQAFTCWYKLFERNGRWMAYHCVGYDV